MNKNEIQLHLIERYINGYCAVDKKYEEIKNYILKEIGTHSTKEKLQNVLLNYLGKYTEFTGGLYYEVLCIYIRKVMHKTPTPELISSLLP